VSQALAKPIIELLPYQKAAVEETSRFCWFNWSRQVGKSFGLSLRRVLRGLERRRLQVLLSAGERQSRELMQKVQMHVRALNIAASLREDTYFEGTSFKQLELQLPNNVRILALPANPNTARGFTGDVFLDEFAMHQHDREIWAALFPTIMRGQGELDVASTPKGKSNMFYTLASNPRFAKSTVTIEDAAAQGLEVDLVELREGLGDPDLWRQEFLCEFLDEAQAFLTHEMIQACEDSSIPGPVGAEESESLRLNAGGPQFVGLDIGRVRDLTVLWVVQQVGHQLPTAAVIELRGLSFREQKDVIWPWLASCSKAAIDATGLGMQIAEEAVEAFGSWKVEPVTFSLKSKEEMANGLRIAVEDRAIRIPVDVAIRNDWHSVTRSPTATGFKYHAERTPSGHADRFWAACLAVRAAKGASGPAEYVGSEQKLTFARNGTW